MTLITTKKLGISKDVLTTLKLIYAELANVYRFGRVTNLTKKNSVKTHTKQLLKMADFVAESFTDEQNKKDLRLLCFIHDMGEVLGELTVAHEDVNNESSVSRNKKDLYEFEIFKSAYLAAKLGKETLASFIELSKMYDSAEQLYNYAKEFSANSKLVETKEDLEIFKKFQGKSMNKMMPTYLKCLDRAEGTIFYCNNAEDIDLTKDSFMEKMITYNLKSIYDGTPLDLGGDDNLINVYKKCRSILKAATRHYKYLCREDRYDIFSILFNGVYDSVGRFYTWGDDNYVYFARNLSDFYNIAVGRFKSYKSLELVYNEC